MNEAQLDRIDGARLARRFKAEDRALARLEKREAKAIEMIGELGSGRYYIFPVGGKYRESSSRVELIDFLLRNNYV